MTFRDGLKPAPSARKGVRPSAKELGESMPTEARDTLLRRAILGSLIAAPGLKTRHVGVEVHGGVVTLTGYVTSNAQKDAADAAVCRVKGVRLMRDTICVALPCADAPDAAAGAADIRTTLTLSDVLARAAAARETGANNAQSDDRS
jgi:hypothetical protein